MFLIQKLKILKRPLKIKEIIFTVISQLHRTGVMSKIMFSIYYKHKKVLQVF